MFVAVSTGCRSQLGAVYSVATGKTTADDVLPPNPQRLAGAPGVTQTAFEPPPIAGAGSPQPIPPGSTKQPLPVGADPLPQPTRDEAFGAVLSELQKLSVENPAAQQELLRRLQDADPGHYELIVRRFKSTLAYHDQLAKPRDARTMIASQESSPLHLVSHGAGLSNVQPGSGSRQTMPGASGDQSRTAMEPSHLNPYRQPSQSTPPQANEPYQTRRQLGEPSTFQQTPYPETSHLPAESSRQSQGHEGNPAIGSVRLASAESAVDPNPMVVNNPYRDQPVAAEPRDWRESLTEAVTALEISAEIDPLSTSEAYDHARLRLLKLAGGELDGAVTPIPGLSPTEQDFWSKQLFAVATMLDHKTQPEAKRRAAAAALHLAHAHDELKQLASLSIRNLTFCDEVFAYGAYDERKSNRFEPGEEVTLYVEVENFRSEKTSDGFHTVIGTSYQVLDSAGKRVDGREFPAVDDYCLSRRRDFHIQYGVTLPERVYAGEYKLELTLTDQLGNKIGKASIDFEIVEPPK